jgi:hypothetical protein
VVGPPFFEKILLDPPPLLKFLDLPLNLLVVTKIVGLTGDGDEKGATLSQVAVNTVSGKKSLPLPIRIPTSARRSGSLDERK